jgi:hypothetical protein
MRRLFLILGLALLPGAATAETAQPPDWSQVETVEVTEPPGPAVWRISKGDSEVWILGTVGAMPKDLAWNRKYLSDLVDGAHAVLMPPRPSIGLLEGAWFLITNGGKLSLPRGQSLEAILPEPLRQHFLAIRTQLGESEGRYRTDSPLRAIWRIRSDFLDKNHLEGREPGAAIRDIASSKHVPVKPVSRYEVLDAAREALNLPYPQQETCLAEALEDIDRMSLNAAPAAHAWAVGDVKTVKAHYAPNRLDDCVIAQVHKVADIDEHSIADFTGAVAEALNQPGKSVAVIDMGRLLRKNGVLDRLAARGLSIEGPAEQ